MPDPLTPLQSLTVIGAVLVVVNVIAFVAFGIDKILARAGRRRISEATLLLWALLGGTPGAYLGRAVYRHKTRKQPFSFQLHAIAALQVAGLVAWRGGWIG